MFTEQFSQHGFKVQIARVNLEICTTAQKGASVSVFSWMLLRECGVPHHAPWLSSSLSATPSSSLSPLYFLESSRGQAVLLASYAHVLTEATRPYKI